MKKSNDIQSRRKQLKLRITIVILIFLLAAIGLGVHVVQNYIPSREHMSLTEYYGQPSDGEMVVVLGTDIMEERALKSGDQIYLPRRQSLSPSGYGKYISESEILLGQR